MRERVYMPDAIARRLCEVHCVDTSHVLGFSDVMDALAWCADVSPRQAREATYRLWGHMIEMNGGGDSVGR